MTKSDLKPGMIVETGDSVRYMYLEIGEKKFFMGKDEGIELSDLDINLRDPEGDEDMCTIMKVYEPSYWYYLCFKDALNHPGTLIWERPEDNTLGNSREV